MTSDIWDSVFEDRKKSIQDAYMAVAAKTKGPEQLSLDNLLAELETFDAFKSRLNAECSRYSQTGVNLIANKINPHLKNFGRFAMVIGEASKGNSTASICWSSMFLVIHCGCGPTKTLEDVVDQLANFMTLIPKVADDVELYKEYNLRLNQVLRDMFENYLDFCVSILKWMQNSPTRNMFNGKLSQTLDGHVSKMKQSEVEHHDIVQDIRKRQEKVMIDKLASIRAPSDPTSPRHPKVSLNSPPRRRNDEFIGRDAELKQLFEHLIEDEPKESNITSCAISGMGGVGKTDLAVEFWYQNRHHYGAVIWISAESDLTLKTGFGEIATSLGFVSAKAGENREMQREVQQVKNWLQTQKDLSWLLVFDNVNSYKDIQPYWPGESVRKSSILATTQQRVPRANKWVDHVVELNVFSRDTGSQLLLSYLEKSGIPDTDANREVAKEISDLHRNLPLFIPLVASAIELEQRSLSNWLKERKGQDVKPDQYDSEGVWTYEKDPSALFDPALKSLSEDARRLLFMLVFLSPDGIPENLLLCGDRDPDLAFVDSSNIPRFRRALRELIQRYFITTNHENDDPDETTFINIHRMTQSILSGILDRDRKRLDATFRSVVKVLRERYPQPDKLMRPAAGTSERALLILPHIMHVNDRFTKLEPPLGGTREFAELLVDVGGMDLSVQGYVQETMAILEVAEKILDDPRVEDTELYRGHVLTVRGMCGDLMGISRRTEMYKWRGECQQLREQWFKKLPSNKRDKDAEVLLYNSYMDVACCLQHLNMFDSVEKTAEKCLWQYKKWGPETSDAEAYEYAKYYNHMAYVHLYRGENDKAVEYAKKGFKFMERNDSESQMTILFQFDWASVLFQAGHKDEAIAEHKRVLERRIETCGEENVRTLESYLTLGVANFLVRRYQAARDNLKLAIKPESNESYMWPRENNVRAKYYLAKASIALDPSDQAAQMDKNHALMEIDRLLRSDPNATMAFDGKGPHVEELRVDYVVAWELRLVTPRQPLMQAEMEWWQLALGALKRLGWWQWGPILVVMAALALRLVW